jgi:DNA-binding XRE family transcriptional regulator
MRVTENMLKWRNLNHYGQKIPAAELHINQQTYSKKERGQLKLRPEEGVILAKLYDAPLSDFCEEKGPEPAPERQLALQQQLIDSLQKIINKDEAEKEVLKCWLDRALSGKVSKEEVSMVRRVMEKM